MSYKKSLEYQLKNAFADIVLSFCCICLTITLSQLWHDMHMSFADLSAMHQAGYNKLIYDLLRSNMRLLVGMIFSLIFSLVAGVAAAKNKHMRLIILPCINIMESIPLVGFMSLSVIVGLYIYPHSIMAVESAAIFGVFTAQAWNMALTVYQSLCVVPYDLQYLKCVYKVSAWKFFCFIELPYAMPGLLWNMMVSQSAAWFALVGTEAIAVGSHTVMLPGVGSYIQMGLDHKNVYMIVYAIVALIINIVIFDHLLFKPLLAWSARFRYSYNEYGDQPISWFYNFLQLALGLQLMLKQAQLLLQCIYKKTSRLWRENKFITQNKKPMAYGWHVNFIHQMYNVLAVIWFLVIVALCVFSVGRMAAILPHFHILTMLNIMMLTTLRVFIAIILSLVIFVPVGVWLSLSSKRLRYVSPFIQVAAALPPDIMYPIMAVLLIHFKQSLTWWCIPLIMLGTQWYILFNVIAGMQSLPTDIYDLKSVFSLNGYYYWRYIIIPSLFPSIMTGIISAAGGAWNADVTAELIQWGRHIIITPGLGSYIAQSDAHNQLGNQVLGCLCMSLLVAVCIIFIWRPLYQLAERHYRMA